MIKTLIVEDENWIRKGIIKVIKWDELGLELIGEADNGEEALHIFEAEKPELVITDMKMPRYSGIEFLKKLANTNMSCEIIVISGFSDYEYMKQAISSNVFEYILKPVDETHLNNILEKVINKLIYKKSMQLKLNESKILLEDNILNSLITGSIEKYDNLLRNANDIKVDLNYTLFSVIAIVLKDPCLDTVKKTNEVNLLIEQLFNEIKHIQIHKLSCNIFKSPKIEGEILILCKSNIGDITELTTEQKYECENILLIVKTKYNMDIRVGIGEWEKGYLNIRTSYQKANIALKYEHMNGKDIILYKTIKEFKMNDGINWAIDENQLDYVLQHSDGSGVATIVRTLFDTARNKSYCNISMLRDFLIKFIVVLERCCQRLNPTFNSRISFEVSYIDVIEQLITVESLQKWAEETIAQFLYVIRAEKIKDNIDIISTIKNYIASNYNEDINLICLAQKFYMNHIYLSRLFKAKTGENFIDYLTRVRMEKAKELLDLKLLKVKEVSEAVGYSNPYYFTNSFKRYYGYPPSET